MQIALPPLTPGPICDIARGCLAIQSYDPSEEVTRHSTAQGYTINYLRECLLGHFEAGRKVFQKMKMDGSGLLPTCVMQLNLEMPEAKITDVYVQMAINEKKLNDQKSIKKLLIIQIHGHYTTPLPR
jgi:hypothetical protein